MAPVIVRNLFKKLAIPIDSGKKLGNKPIFGRNKTWRGLIFGVIFAIIISFIQYLFFNNNIFVEISLIDYNNWLLLGLLMGAGALVGDLVESFFKRRLNYKPGQSFVPFDQIDFVLGALIFTYPIVRMPIDVIITIIIISFVLHIIVNHLSYYLKIRGEKW
jgi:CDP-2,3-bis-(O-geranylgeranyl)-sn-glycerol synthase